MNSFFNQHLPDQYRTVMPCLNQKTLSSSKKFNGETNTKQKDVNVVRTIKNKKVVYCQLDKTLLTISAIGTNNINSNNSSNNSNEYSNNTNTQRAYEGVNELSGSNSKETSDCTTLNNDICIEEDMNSNQFGHVQVTMNGKNFIKRGKRGSKYRGVSKNGNQWQVLIMVNKKKRYIGNYKTEDEAAASYDIVAIQNHGKKAKTNFFYTIDEIHKIKNQKRITWRC